MIVNGDIIKVSQLNLVPVRVHSHPKLVYLKSYISDEILDVSRKKILKNSIGIWQ